MDTSHKHTKIFCKRKANPNNNFLIKNSLDRNLNHLYFGDFEKIKFFFIRVWIYLAKDKIRKHNLQCPLLLLPMLHTMGILV